jgi:hypothetical protein
MSALANGRFAPEAAALSHLTSILVVSADRAYMSTGRYQDAKGASSIKIATALFVILAVPGAAFACGGGSAPAAHPTGQMSARAGG